MARDSVPWPQPDEPFGISPAMTTTFLDPETSSPRPRDDDDNDNEHDGDGDEDGAGSTHIRMASPQPRPRPGLPTRNTFKGNSTKNMQEALRLARRREEQETLLGEHEEADDDGCYPPRKNDDPRAPNPHSELPVYTTIHKIRRLVIASIGRQSRVRVRGRH